MWRRCNGATGLLTEMTDDTWMPSSVEEAWKNDALGDYFKEQELKELVKRNTDKKVRHTNPGYELFQAMYEYLLCRCSGQAIRPCRVCEKVQELIAELRK